VYNQLIKTGVPLGALYAPEIAWFYHTRNEAPGYLFVSTIFSDHSLEYGENITNKTRPLSLSAQMFIRMTVAWNIVAVSFKINNFISRFPPEFINFRRVIERRGEVLNV
jgi:hypothetical protein